jgi:putative spermidine/putrescine transport system substrate-binding protein
MTHVTRWLLLLGSLLVAVQPAGTRAAEEKVVNVMGWGGDYERQLTSVLGPAFQRETGYAIRYFSKASSAEMVATVRAQQSAPTLDVIIGDEGPQAAAPSLWAAVDPKDLPNLEHMYPLARIEGSGRVRAFAAAVGIIYQKRALEERGVTPPKRWADLWSPAYRGLVTMPAPTNVYGYCAFVAAARLEGGSQARLEAGYERMAALARGLATVVRGSAQLTDALGTGTALVAVYSDSTAYRIHQKGIPIAFVYPEDGAFFTPLSIAVVERAPHPAGARLFLNFMLGEQAQKLFAESFGYGPLNRKVVLTGDAAAWTTYGPERVSALVPLDWELMAKTLPGVVEKWNAMLQR